MNAEVLKIVVSWFNKLDAWQKDLFINLWKGKNVDDLKVRSKKLALKEYGIEDSHFVAETKFPEDIEEEFTVDSQVMLKMISEVQGVSALKPTRPLEFTKGLNVVYGANGCGKTSYVKVLKKAENPKENIKIYSNIFEEENAPAKATLVFDEDGAENIIHWSMSNQRVCPIRIYDTDVAHRFVTDSTETVYEPKLLHIFTLMSEIYDSLNKEISDEIATKNIALVSVPKEFTATDLYHKYEKLKFDSDFDDFDAQTSFSETDEKELAAVEKSFETKDPIKAQKSLSAQVLILQQLEKEITEAFYELAESKVVEYLKARKDQIDTRRAFEKFIESFKSISEISEFGSEQWRNMWIAAQAFENSIHNKSAVENICLLCQQDLSVVAKQRMEKFQEIYLSDLEKQQNQALKNLSVKTEQLSKLMNNNLNLITVKERLISNSFEEREIDYYVSIIESLLSRAKWLYEYSDDSEDAVPLPSFDEFKKETQRLIEEKNSEIEALKSFVESYDKQVQTRDYLKSKKWFSLNKTNIELKRRIFQLNNILVKFKTNNITKTKNSLSEKLITEVYIERFTSELSALNPSKSIRVELVSDGKKGKTSHRVCIKGAITAKKTDEILSEGEARVVSIAAFLADLNSISKTQAFIFDDPITSLDHNYEDNVAKQLVKLSLQRQVIVFTHRLAFAELLNSCMSDLREKLDLSEADAPFNYIELLKRPLGEPVSNGKYNSLKFVNVLNKFKDVDLRKLHELQNTGEYELFDDKLQSLCSKFRKTIEKGIETELLSGIVLRHNKEVSSRKIRYINAVQEDDIKLFDSMMTKYSFQEHSYSSEKTIELPELDEIANDIDEMIKWEADFKKRRKAYD